MLTQWHRQQTSGDCHQTSAAAASTPSLLLLNEAPRRSLASVREGWGRNSGAGELFAFPAAEASPDWVHLQESRSKEWNFHGFRSAGTFQRDLISSEGGGFEAYNRRNDEKQVTSVVSYFLSSEAKEWTQQKVQVPEMRRLLLSTRKGGLLLRYFLEKDLFSTADEAGVRQRWRLLLMTIHISQTAGSGDFPMPRLPHLYPRTAFRGTHHLPGMAQWATWSWWEGREKNIAHGCYM